MDPQAMTEYAGLCGWMLARGHARSGDPIAIAGYLGTNDINEEDYTVLREACATGRLETAEG